MAWDKVGSSEHCLTYVHEDGYLIHGTELAYGDGESEWILEVTDARGGDMLAQERYYAEERSEVLEKVEELHEAYP